MKILRRKEEPTPPANAPRPAARPTPKILVRAAAPPKPEPPKISKEEEDRRKIGKLLEDLGVLGCDGSVDMAAAVEAAGFGVLQVRCTARLEGVQVSGCVVLPGLGVSRSAGVDMAAAVEAAGFGCCRCVVLPVWGACVTCCTAGFGVCASQQVCCMPDHR